MKSPHLDYLLIGHGEESKPVTIPFVIKEHDPEEKILYYTGDDMMEDQIKVINGVEYKFYGRRSIDRANASRLRVGPGGHADYGNVNVGTVGHIDWGRRGYLPDIKDISWSTPSVTWQYYLNPRFDYSLYERMGLRAYYMARISEGYTDLDSIRATFKACRKLTEPYLGFENGGLIVAGRVIWILPDKEYAKFHKRAAEWVLPSKEYVKSVVARYLGKPYEIS